jgi:rod shape-determining protein MreD
MLVGVGWLAALFDSSLAPLVEVAGIAPSAILLSAAVSLAVSKSEHSFLFAAWFGLVADLCGAGRLGVCLGCFTLVGYAILRLRGRAGARMLMGRAAEVVFATLAMAAAVAVVQALFNLPTVDWSGVLRHSLGVGLYTACLALPLVAFPLKPPCPFPQHQTGSM